MADPKPWELDYEEPKPWDLEYEKPETPPINPLANPLASRALGTVESTLAAGVRAFNPFQRRSALDIITGGALPTPEVLSKPLVKVPPAVWETLPVTEAVKQFAPSEKAKAIATGVESAGTDTANFFTSPIGIATLGIGSLPAAAQRATALAFSAQMAKDVPEIAKQLGDELGKPEGQRDYAKISKLTANAIANTAFSALGAAHGLKPEIKPATEVAQPKETDASINREAKKIYGNMLPLPIEGTRQVPVEEGQPRVQPQAEGGLPKEKEITPAIVDEPTGPGESSRFTAKLPEGYATGFVKEGTAELVGIEVEKAARRKGIGERLLRQFAEKAKQSGATSITGDFVPAAKSLMDKVFGKPTSEKPVEDWPEGMGEPPIRSEYSIAPPKPKQLDVDDAIARRKEVISEIDKLQPLVTREQAWLQGHPELEGQAPWNKEADVLRAELEKLNAQIPIESPQIQSVVSMSGQDFARFSAREGNRGLTEKAYELADSLRDSDPAALDKAKEQATSQAQAAKSNIADAPTDQKMKLMEDALALSMKRQYFDEAAKMSRALKQVEAGKDVSEVAKDIGVSEKALKALQKAEPTKPEPAPAIATPETQKAAVVAQRIPAGSGRGIAYQVRAGNPKAAEMGAVNLGIVADIFDAAKDKWDDVGRALSGIAAPKTSKASEESGNALVRYASANQSAPYLARSMTQHVLGANRKNVDFRQRLGAVLVEDRLRAIRQGLQSALSRPTDPKEQATLRLQVSRVNSLVGQGKYFSDESAFQSSLQDPDISAAIQRHKDTVQKAAEMFHTEAGGQLAGPGVHTGAFVNLEALHEDMPEMVFGSGAKGDYTRPFKRPSRFSKQATGSAAKYQLDYDRLAERMIRGNFEEYSKRQMYQQLEKDGLAMLLPSGMPRPDIGGKPAKAFPVQRGYGKGQTLWVRNDLSPEVRNALNIDGPIAEAGMTKVANVLNRIQLAGPTDAVFHTANIFKSIAGQQGGRNVLIDLARKIPGVNLVDTTIRLGIRARDVLQDNPEVVKELSDLAIIGATRPEGIGGGPTTRFIRLLDKSARLVRNDMFDNLVQRGLETNTEARRREFVNQIGNYNPRLMGQFQRFFKESGLAPFIVAGRTFNRMAMRRIALDPGFKPPTKAAWAQAKAVEAFGLMATLVAVPAFINTLTTGNPGGRKGVLFGQIDLGTDDDKGNHKVLDPAEWVGLRRGMRLTGLNAVLNGIKQGKPAAEIERNAGRDIASALIHPWAGPTIQAGEVLRTGKTTGGFQESANPNDYTQNFLAAIKQLNPVAHAFFKNNDQTFFESGKDVVRSMGGAAGVKGQRPISQTEDIRTRARDWGLNNKDPKIKHGFEQRGQERFLSDYKPLRDALHENNNQKIVKAVRDMLLLEDSKANQEKRMKQILKEFQPFSGKDVKPFATPTKQTEIKFLNSLDAQGKAAYRDAIKEQIETYRRLTKALYGKEQNPPMP